MAFQESSLSYHTSILPCLRVVFFLPCSAGVAKLLVQPNTDMLVYIYSKPTVCIDLDGNADTLHGAGSLWSGRLQLVFLDSVQSPGPCRLHRKVQNGVSDVLVPGSPKFLYIQTQLGVGELAAELGCQLSRRPGKGILRTLDMKSLLHVMEELRIEEASTLRIIPEAGEWETLAQLSGG